MAQPLASITTLNAIGQYAAESAAAAAGKCPAAQQAYLDAVNVTQSLAQMQQTSPMGWDEAGSVEQVRRMILAANQTCKANLTVVTGTPVVLASGTTTPVESADPTDMMDYFTGSSSGGGGFPWWLVGLAAVGAVWYFSGKRKGGKSGGKKKSGKNAKRGRR